MDKLKSIPKNMWIIIGVAFLVLVIFIIFTVSKNSGGSKFDTEGANKVTVTAGQYMDEGDYLSAYQLLTQAEEENVLDQTGASLLETAKSTLYTQFVTAGNTSQSEQNYGQAVKHFENAVAFATSDAEVRESEQLLEQANGLLDEQEQLRSDFKDYTMAMQDIMVKSNAILSQYKTDLDEVSTGALTPAGLIENSKTYISRNDVLISKLDDSLFVQNDTLLEIHKSFISHMNVQHSMLTDTLGITNETIRSDLSYLRSTYLDIKTEQVSLIQEVNNFSSENNLGLKLENPNADVEVKEEKKSDKKTSTNEKTAEESEVESSNKEESAK